MTMNFMQFVPAWGNSLISHGTQTEGLKDSTLNKQARCKVYKSAVNRYQNVLTDGLTRLCDQVSK